MRTVVAVDWSEQSVNAVKVVGRLFTHEELALIHAVDRRPFEHSLFGQPLGRKSVGNFRQAMVGGGRTPARANRRLHPLYDSILLSDSTRSGSRFQLCWNTSVRLKRTWLRSDRRGVDDSRS